MSKKQSTRAAKAVASEATVEPSNNSMTIVFKQADTLLNIEVTGNVTEADKSKLYGTALNELFETVKIQANTGAKFFKLNQPIQVSVQINDLVVDTAKAEIKLQQKLKLNKTPQSFRRFAQRFVTIADHVTRERKVVDVDSVLESVK